MVENDRNHVAQEKQREGGEQRVDAGKKDRIMQALAHATEFAVPKFWPMIGPIEPDSEKMMPKATGTMRPMMAAAATTSFPNSATARVA